MAGDSFAGQRRLPLITLPTVSKTVITALWAVLTAAWAAFLRLELTSPQPASGLMLGVAIIIGLGVIVPVTVAMLEALRFAAWLEGTMLVVRHLAGAGRCDLARSTITLATSRGLPQLRARDPVTGRRVRLVLGNPRSRTVVAPHKLLAVADAITAGGRVDPGAAQVAAALRALAAARQGAVG